MKTNSILLLVAVFWAATSFSQYKITYSHSAKAEWAKSSFFINDTSMWVNASYALNAGGYGILMLQLGSAGQITDVKLCEKPTFSFSGFWAGSLLKIDSNYYTGCEISYPDPTPKNPGDRYAFPGLVKYNLNGDTVWVKHYEIDTSYLYEANSCRATQDRGILLCGSKSTSIPGTHDFLLSKFDTAGNLLWLKTYGVLNRDERAISVEELPDGSIILSGMKQYGGTVPFADYEPWILKLDKDGNVKTSKQYALPSLKYGGVVVQPALNGYGYWMSGLSDSVQNPNDYQYYHFLARLDDNFNIIRRIFFNNKYFTQIWDFHELDNGDVVFCGDKDDSATQNQFGFIARIDSFGNLKWWRTYHEYTGNNNYLTCIRPAPDGGFVACGSAFGLPNGASQDAWIIKTDSMGCVVANCYLGVEDIAAAKAGIKVYPNPATHEVSISLYGDQPFPKDALVSAYDITGKRVARLQPGGQQKITIPVSSWNNGTYLITVQRANGDISTAKVNIVK